MRIEIQGPTSYRGRNARPNWLAPLASIVIALAAGALGALFSPGVATPAVFLIVALWLSLVWTLREFSVVRPSAAWLMLPNLAWVSLGMALNLSIWRHNL
jgi:hypothetical protein